MFMTIIGILVEWAARGLCPCSYLSNVQGGQGMVCVGQEADCE